MLYGANSVTLRVDAAQPADRDDDGDVDGHDFLIWQRGGSPNPLSASDLTDWKTNYGTGSLVAASVAVPEPTAAILLGLVGFGWATRLNVCRSRGAALSSD